MLLPQTPPLCEGNVDLIPFVHLKCCCQTCAMKGEGKQIANKK